MEDFVLVHDNKSGNDIYIATKVIQHIRSTRDNNTVIEVGSPYAIWCKETPKEVFEMIYGTRK